MPVFNDHRGCIFVPEIGTPPKMEVLKANIDNINSLINRLKNCNSLYPNRLSDEAFKCRIEIIFDCRPRWIWDVVKHQVNYKNGELLDQNNCTQLKECFNEANLAYLID